MRENFGNEPMLDMFIFETVQLIKQLEQLIVGIKRSNYYTENSINEIFRIMHTIKGSSAMMHYENISFIAHTIEDLFYFLREERPKNIECLRLTDIVLESADFIKNEADKIMNSKKADGDASELIMCINNCLSDLKINNSTVDDKKNEFLSNNVVFLKDLLLNESKADEYQQLIIDKKAPQNKVKEEETQFATTHQSTISVNIQKLDKLMDLVGELVISEARVIQNPDLNELVLDNFQKAARQLQKITGELQDTVMSIRMVSLSTTFKDKVTEFSDRGVGMDAVTKNIDAIEGKMK